MIFEWAEAKFLFGIKFGKSGVKHLQRAPETPKFIGPNPTLV